MYSVENVQIAWFKEESYFEFDNMPDIDYVKQFGKTAHCSFSINVNWNNFRSILQSYEDETHNPRKTTLYDIDDGNSSLKSRVCARLP